MNDISKPMAENALQGNLVELSQQNGKTHLQIQTLNEMVERLREENAKLQAERDEWHRVAESKQDIIDHMRDARTENAKLREYAESYAKAVEGEGCGWCPYDIDLVCDTETMPMRDGCRLYGELRELGVKVE